jgi:hypothetical protein
MTEWEKLFYYDRLYAYAMRSLEKNKHVYEYMKERGMDTTHIEIEIEAAEYALGMKEDKPKVHSFIDNRRIVGFEKNFF